MPTPFVSKLVEVCEEECAYFGDGAKLEYEDSVYERVGDYWTELVKTSGDKRWEGYNGQSEVIFKKDGTVDNDDNAPWSAAFISYVMSRAGAGDTFAYSSSHATYILRALEQEKRAKPTSPFVARRHKLYAPRLGDLIGCERRPEANPNFDTYKDFVAEKKYHAHCDVVTEVADDYVVTIGGNVRQSVRRKKWPLDGQGMIDNVDPLSPTAGVICIIENRL